MAGYNVANKAAVVYAGYLETDDERKRSLLAEVAQRCEEQQEKTPTDVNAWYLHAFRARSLQPEHLGGQGARQGLGGKIKHSLTQALELAAPARRRAYRAWAPITPR
jgi:hypothetical protein